MTTFEPPSITKLLPVPGNPATPDPAEPASSILPEADSSRRVVNYFTAPETALRYAANRPRGHPRVLELVAEFLEDVLPVERALDVGCGTSHSTVALLPYAKWVTGLDSSSAMLAQAQQHARIEYRKGYAEALPFRPENFDLLTVSAAYHWFDHRRFLREAARVLRPGGWLVLYKAGSIGRAPEQPAFEHWRREVLRSRYPKVARNNDALSPLEAANFGFREMACVITTHRETHAIDAYIENLMTHSSIIRVVDGGQEPIEVARAWLRGELAPFFPGNHASFTHDVRIHVLRRTPQFQESPASDQSSI